MEGGGESGRKEGEKDKVGVFEGFERARRFVVDKEKGVSRAGRTKRSTTFQVSALIDEK